MHDTQIQRLAGQLPGMMKSLLYRWPCHRYAAGQDLRILLAASADAEEALLPAALNALFAACHLLGYQLHLGVVSPHADELADRWAADLDPSAQYLSRSPRWEPYPWDVFYAQLSARNAAPALLAPIAQDWDVRYLIVLHPAGQAGRALAASAGCPFACCLCSEGTTEEHLSDGRTLVTLCPDDCDAPIREEVEQIAFNAHLLYEKEHNPDIDLSTIRRTFARSYQHDASMDTALSVKCRLASAGVPWSTDREQMAAGFTARLREEPSMPDALSWLEHRRWVASKLAQGARVLEDQNYDALLDGGPGCSGSCLRRKDEAGTPRLYHSYLVPSALRPRPEGWRTTAEWAAHAPDTPLPPELDPLDRAGVLLHRQFAAAADGTDVSRPVETLRELVSQTVRAFRGREPAAASRLDQLADRFYSAVTALCRADAAHSNVRQYTLAHQALHETLLSLQGKAPWTDSALAALELVHRTAFCFVEKLRFTDPKRLDDTLILHLPFLLCHRDLCLCKLLDTEHLQNNVRSVRMLAPASLTYAALAQTEQDVPPLLAVFHPLRDFLLAHGEASTIRLCLFVPPALAGRDFGPDVRVTVLPEQNRSRAMAEALSGCDALDLTGGQSLLCAWGAELPPDRCTVFECRGTGLHLLRGPALWPLPFPVNMTADQLLSLSGAVTDSTGSFLAKARFQELYALYREILSWPDGAKAWYDACNAFNDAYTSASRIVFYPPYGDAVREPFRKELRGPAGRSLQPVFLALQQEGFLRDLTDTVVYDADGRATHHLRYLATSGLERRLASLTERTGKGWFLIQGYGSFPVDGEQHFQVLGQPNEIRLKEPLSPEAKAVFAHFASRDLLTFEERPYGTVLTVNDADLTRILSRYGTALEASLHTALSRCGGFHDVVSNVLYSWNREQTVLNELDVVAARGLRMAVISCKASHMTGEEGKKALLFAAYELVTQTRRLRVDALPVLVLSELDLEQERPDAAARCRELGILVIDKTSLERAPALLCSALGSDA